MSVIDKVSEIQTSELNKALEFIKNCDYKGTAVKVELEAHLDRPESEERETCFECSGNGVSYCDNCDDGEVHCDCDDGNVTTDGVTTPCEECDGSGWIECGDCGGVNRSDCDECDGSGSVDGSGCWDDDSCEQYILDAVSREAREALVFGKFYNDGSVDSEYTFTLKIEKAIHVLEYIEAFKSLAEEIGNGMNVDGAGMHIAILNSPDCDYQGLEEYDNNDDGNSLSNRKAENFRKSLTPLLPALFFLASSNHKSRSLRYRPPTINLNNKYAAISGQHHVFEYRLFETCYDNPLAFIDNMLVIAKTLKFYSNDYIDTSMKIGNLGFKEGEGIERFYYTTKHLDALTRGLKLLKPDYKTIAQLERERNFKISKKDLSDKEKKQQQEWRAEFAGVKSRRKFERLRFYHSGLARGYEYLGQGVIPNAEYKTPQEYARYYMKSRMDDRNLKGDVRQYIKQRTSEFLTDNVNYTVTV